MTGLVERKSVIVTGGGGGVGEGIARDLQMIAQNGGEKIIGTASIAGKVGEQIATIYCASKACVISLSQAGAEAFGRYSITVNCFRPGFVKT